VDAVIVRIWEAQVVPERVEEFSDLFASTILPRLTAAEGCLGGEVLRPVAGEKEDEARIIGITRWRDEESLRALLGPMWRVRPMWEEQELEYLLRPPRVSHFEPVETPPASERA
jgi:quinol monooxygenase YgiN